MTVEAYNALLRSEFEKFATSYILSKPDRCSQALFSDIVGDRPLCHALSEIDYRMYSRIHWTGFTPLFKDYLQQRRLPLAGRIHNPIGVNSDFPVNIRRRIEEGLADYPGEQIHIARYRNLFALKEDFHDKQHPLITFALRIHQLRTRFSEREFTLAMVERLRHSVSSLYSNLRIINATETLTRVHQPKDVITDVRIREQCPTALLLQLLEFNTRPGYTFGTIDLAEEELFTAIKHYRDNYGEHKSRWVRELSNFFTDPDTFFRIYDAVNHSQRLATG